MAKIIGLTDIGKKRATNQDAYDIVCFDDGAGMAVICDGMGGAKGGDEASRLAVSIIHDRITRAYNPTLDEEGVRGLLIAAAQEANRSIFATARGDDKLSGMGTTLVLALLRGDRLHIVHAGDSRAYAVAADGTLAQLTRDHSLVQNMIENGEITPDEAVNHPQKNVVTKVLGVLGDIETDYTAYSLRKGDKILLCTDGLSGFVTDADIEAIFTAKRKATLEKLPPLLIDAANAAGGGDNITVVVMTQ